MLTRTGQSKTSYTSRLHSNAKPLAIRALLCVTGLLTIFCGCTSSFRSSQLLTENPHDFQQVHSIEADDDNGYYSPSPKLPAPAEVKPGPERMQPLSLHRALYLALQQNPQLRVAGYLPQEAQLGIDLADSQFDPRLSMGTQWSENSTQVTSAVEAGGEGVSDTITESFGGASGMGEQISVNKQLRTGGSISAGVGTVMQNISPSGGFLTLNPSWRSSMSFTFQHPLARNLGYQANTISIRMARSTYQAARYQTELAVNSTLLSVHSAYWSLYSGIADLVSQERSLREAQETWEKETQKLQLGDSSLPQVAQTREQLERFKANNIKAQEAVDMAERKLRQILGLPLDDGTRIIPVSTPVSAAPSVNWQTAVMEAFRNRPELKLQEANLMKAQFVLDGAANGLRPDVNATAGYSITGTEGQFEQSVSTLADTRYRSWWLGLMYQRPLGGRRAEKSLHTQAMLGLTRERLTMKNLREQIHAELYDAQQSLQNNWKIIKMQRDRRIAAEEILRAHRAMYQVGETGLDMYLRAQATVSGAVAGERAAVATYNRALAAWEFTRGSILEYSGVRFENEEEQKPQAADPDVPGTQDFLDEYVHGPKESVNPPRPKFVPESQFEIDTSSPPGDAIPGQPAPANQQPPQNIPLNVPVITQRPQPPAQPDKDGFIQPLRTDTTRPQAHSFPRNARASSVPPNAQHAARSRNSAAHGFVAPLRTPTHNNQAQRPLPRAPANMQPAAPVRSETRRQHSPQPKRGRTALPIQAAFGKAGRKQPTKSTTRPTTKKAASGKSSLRLGELF